MRPIGKNIRQIMSALSVYGTCTYKALHTHLVDLELGNAVRYCNRAAELELLTINKTVQPFTCTVKPGWEQLMEKHQNAPRRKVKQALTTPNRRVSSVWELGSL